MVPRPSSRFPRMLKHPHESPLSMINYLLRSPRLKAGASRGIPVLRMITAPGDMPSSMDAGLDRNSVEVGRLPQRIRSK